MVLFWLITGSTTGLKRKVPWLLSQACVDAPAAIACGPEGDYPQPPPEMRSLWSAPAVIKYATLGLWSILLEEDDMVRALVLQGGGALGAYELGVVKRLYELPDFRLDIVSGVSIGAINASVLVGADRNPTQTLQEVWDHFAVHSLPFVPDWAEQMIALFGNKDFFQPRTDYFRALFWTSFYDTEPLRNVLDRFIDFDKLNDNRSPRLLITATNIETGHLEIFDNRKTRIGADHIIASASLPPAFPMTMIDGQFYWDGALFSNTPLAPVIEVLPDDPHAMKQIYVVNLFPSEAQRGTPNTMLEVFDRIFELIFASKIKTDVETARRINEYVEVMNEIELSLPIDSPIRQLPGYKRLTNYKLVRDIIVIENKRQEIVFGAFDFSEDTIRERVRAGYEDAAKALSERVW